MRKLTIDDVRAAIMSVCKFEGVNLYTVSNNDLLKSSFKNLRIGKERIPEIAKKLQNTHQFSMPNEAIVPTPETMKSFMKSVNDYFTNR